MRTIFYYFFFHKCSTKNKNHHKAKGRHQERPVSHNPYSYRNPRLLWILLPVIGYVIISLNHVKSHQTISPREKAPVRHPFREQAPVRHRGRPVNDPFREQAPVRHRGRPVNDLFRKPYSHRNHRVQWILLRVIGYTNTFPGGKCTRVVHKLIGR